MIAAVTIVGGRAVVGEAGEAEIVEIVPELFLLLSSPTHAEDTANGRACYKVQARRWQERDVPNLRNMWSKIDDRAWRNGEFIGVVGFTNLEFIQIRVILIVRNYK